MVSGTALPSFVISWNRDVEDLIVRFHSPAESVRDDDVRALQPHKQSWHAMMKENAVRLMRTQNPVA
jgi:hypothetical protein